MNLEDLSREERRFQIRRFCAVPLEWIPPIAAMAVTLLAAVGLLGNLLGSPALQSFIPGLPAMKSGEAVMLLFLGLTLWLLQPNAITPQRQRAGQMLVLLCFLPIILSVSEMHLIAGPIPDWEGTRVIVDANQNGAAIQWDVAQTISALALFLLSFRRSALSALMQGLAIFVLTMAIVILFGHIYCATAIFSDVDFIGMAVPTALGLTFLTSGILFTRPHEGIMRLFTSGASGGIIMRRLLLIVIVAPVMIDWFMLVGQRVGVLTEYFGLAVHEVLTTLLITLFVINIALTLNREEKLRQRAEAGVKKHQSDLAHLVRINTMGEMVASIAHELKQPLTAISLYAATSKDMLSATDTPINVLQQHMDEIQRQALRAADIIRRTREFARKKEPQAIRMQLNDLINEVSEFLNVEAKNCGVQIQLKLASQLPTIEGDPIQLRQVLLNIIHNAIESLQANEDKPKKVIVQTSLTEAGEVCTEIRDNGPGMDTDTLGHIFESFFTTKKEVGMGMGLSISRSIIESHGGRLWATSTPGQGATFIFSLPQ